LAAVGGERSEKNDVAKGKIVVVVGSREEGKMKERGRERLRD
jgi:hypothetical protein